MIGHLAQFPQLALMLLTATGYALATVGMKMASGGATYQGMIVIVLALAGAALAEIVLLRTGHMSMVYLGIIVTETVLVLAYAAAIGHGLSPVQMAGAALVLAGFGLVTYHG